jgi:membrane-bound lytic murein transglycosylase D
MKLMKNVTSFVKLRRLVKSLAATYLVLFLGLVGSAFKTEASDASTTTSPGKGDLQTDKYGFKSLFGTNVFDPSQPYITQLNPGAVAYVQAYVREYGVSLEKMKIWGKPYLDLYDGILSGYGLPKELKYLSVIESDLVSNAVSIAGAVGPWQIMPSEALRLGLKINSRVDERKNYSKSTHAAAKILRGLYSQFNDWTLVIAAYNCGEGRLRQAIRKSGSKNFWELQAYLPAETRNHVKRFIGTHYIFEGGGGLTTMTAAELQNFHSKEAATTKPSTDEENPGTTTMEISGKYSARVLAKNLGIELSLFSKLNPSFDKRILSGDTYIMRLPSDKIAVFNSNKNNILSESVQLLLNGETVPL